MQNLEQLRAAHAITHVGQLDKRAISKLPPLILNNGLLSAVAFTLDGGGENQTLPDVGRRPEHGEAPRLVVPSDGH